jgi:CAAX protease family protein
LLYWGRLSWPALAWALGGGVVIAAVLIAADQAVPLAERGGALPQSMLLPMLAVAIFGNLTEDVLVRGYVQGYLGTFLSPVRAAISSGFFVALFHVFPAVGITGLGVPVLAYALFDGLVCAFVRMKAGLIPAAVSHGMGIVVLATGLI